MRCSAGLLLESHVLQRQRTLEWLNAVSQAPNSPSDRQRRASADQLSLTTQSAHVGPWGPVVRRRRPSFFGR